jgi:hypothetical protein
MIRLVQLQHATQGRRVALVDAAQLRLLRQYRTVYDCALTAIENNSGLERVVLDNVSEWLLDYDAIYADKSEWRLLPAFDHPDEPARCLITGTGLTHKQSADNRDAMHRADKTAAPPVTDSKRMYQSGVEGGRPEPGQIGVQPEWFYKGCGTILRPHGAPLEVPAYAEDGGEEAEIAAAYLNDAQGRPWRVGFAISNEFSDHKMERQNYLYLAPSKLRECALGPELVVGADFGDVQGHARIERAGETLWEHALLSGEANMTHTLANLEHHQFKYAAHRRPGDVHIHFFGTGAFSFGDNVVLDDGDIMEIAFEGYGRPLHNPVRLDRSEPTLTTVGVL